jgi:hypothetical protein
MTDVSLAARTIIEYTERQRANYMRRAATLIDGCAGPVSSDLALRVESAIYQAGNCDARILRFRRIADEG